jgi:ankyrin repeat protein
MNGHHKIVRKLMKHEMNRDYLDISDSLDVAAERGHVEVVKEVLKCTFFQHNIKCNQILHSISHHNQSNAIKVSENSIFLLHFQLLIKSNRRTTHYYPRKDNTTALHLAAAHGHLEVVQLLVKAKHFNLTVTKANDLGFSIQFSHFVVLFDLMY